MNSTEIKIKLAEMLAENGYTINDLEQTLQAMKTAEATQVLEMKKEADGMDAGSAIKGTGALLALPVLLSALGGAAAGYGGFKAHQAIRGSNTKVQDKQREIEEYRNAIKEIHSAKQNPM